MPLGILHGLWPTYQPTKSRAFLSMPSTGFMLKGTPLAHFFCTCKLKEFRKTPETWAAMMLVNSVGNAKSVGSIVQSKKNNTTNIIKHLHVYGVFNFKHWPIPDFRLMFFFWFFRKEPWTIAVNWEHHFHFLYWMTHLRYTTGIPFSHDHGMIMSKISAKFRIISGMGLMGCVKQQKKPGQWLPPRFAIPQNFRVNVGTVEVS